MAITSAGYDGTVDETQFEAIMGYSAHSLFGVASGGAFAASNVAGQVLQVRIAAGTAWTAGLVDVMDAAQTVQISAPPATGSRWDMIVLRRDYQPPGGNTTLSVIKGTASKTLPARAVNGGVLSEQPLWLCRVDAGSGLVNEFIDLRVWARSGGCTANHDLVRSYMGLPGTMIEINGKLWQLRIDSAGANEWVELLASSTSSAGEASGKLVRKDATGRFGVVDPLTATQAANKRYVDNHVPIRIYNNGAVIDVGNDGVGPFLRSFTASERTYGLRANMYITSNGVIGRSTVPMASQADVDNHVPTRIYNNGAIVNVGTDGTGHFVQSFTIQDRPYDANANVFITSEGKLGRATRSTSAEKYKTNIRDHAIDPAKVLALRPVIFDRPEGTKDEFGVVADESVENLPELVGHVDGDVETFHYDRLPVAQHYVLKDHEARIADLESKLERALALIADPTN